jgi:ribosomal protein S18 acetylase RimI-like enzyme
MNIVPNSKLDKITINHFFLEHWGSSEMVISSGTFQCNTLDGFAVLSEKEEIIGLITYKVHAGICEIISLDSLVKKSGIGSLLVNKVEQIAHEKGTSKIKVITTNDNLIALSFYQKRGYQIIEVLANAVDLARKIKPEIPLTAENGIPIRDEIVLQKCLKIDQVLIENTQYIIHDKSLSAEVFLSLVNDVWPGKYNEKFTYDALQKTMNITAWQNDRLVGCVRILTDGYFFGTITEILVLPEFQKTGIGKQLMGLAWKASPTSLFFGAQPGKEPFFEKLGYVKGIQSFQKKKERRKGETNIC